MSPLIVHGLFILKVVGILLLLALVIVRSFALEPCCCFDTVIVFFSVVKATIDPNTIIMTRSVVIRLTGLLIILARKARIIAEILSLVSSFFAFFSFAIFLTFSTE
ncbi:MAG: hypothetical protein IKO19_05050 [Candidatus Riflebacteria bacterium]|nr:hypothetical protein [Candidatus Riflebacteria bacterium]